MTQKSGDYILATTMMLKVLTNLAPQQAWTSHWLHANLREKYPNGMTLGEYRMEYKGQPKGSGTEHQWRIYTENPQLRIILDNAVIQRQPGIVPTRSHTSNQESSFNWKGLTLRSEAERKIAEELEKRNILFFVNARCRVPNRNNTHETKEADFIVFWQGLSRILEVDGREYHQTAAEDHKRDRLFERYGLRTTRFTGSECLNNPELVIDEFLELFDAKNLDNLKNVEQTIRNNTEKTITIDCSDPNDILF